MAIDAGMRAYLLADPGVAALVDPQSIACGGDLDEEAPYPAIIITITNSVPELSLAGPVGVDRTEITCSVLAIDTETRNALDIANEVARAVIEALHGYRGAWGDREVQGVFLATRADETKDEEANISGVMLEFTVIHSAA